MLLLQEPGVHERAVDRLAASYRAIPHDAPVRLAKKTSNLFRARAASSAPGLDVSGLGGVIAVDPVARTADVQGMCTYEHLVDATLPHGLAPLVVPQLKTITLGGAVTGLGIESTSFRNGLPHESVLEMDVLTGSGEIVTATPEGEHADLFHGFPNSYGTLGYATRLRIALEPVQPFVELRHVRFHDLESLVAVMGAVASSGTHDGVAVDYLDGVVFSATEAYLTLGRKTSEPGPVSDYTGQRVYYRSIQHDAPEPRVDRLTIHDYLWRWDTDWFWCSRAFGAQNPRLRRLWPRRYRRSSFYWKLIALDHRFDIADRLEARQGRPPRERVVQDIEVPLGCTPEFLHWFLREIPIEPIWLCPVRSRDRWPLYPLRPGETYVNVGFWSSVPRDPSAPDGAANRLIEAQVSALHGHKSLYSDAYYDQGEFWQLYGGDAYAVLKSRYDPESRLLDLYAKAVQTKVTLLRNQRSDSPAERLSMAQILEALTADNLPLRFTAFDGSATGPDDATFGLDLKSPRGASYLATAPGDLGMARAYVAGDMDLVGVHPGDPYDLLVALGDLQFRLPPPRTAAAVARSLGPELLKPPPPPPQEALPRWRRVAEGLRHTRTRDSEAIHHHYDVSNAFYEHVLGPAMTYTCACYPHEGATHEEAQENKYRLVFEKLRLSEGDRLLDIGCGWGGMVRYAARRGVSVIGATLSREQAAWAQEAIRTEGLQDLAEVRHSDYRDIRETGFDAVSSIGLTEHIGVRNYPSYFGFIKDRLRTGGLVLNHSITRPDNRRQSTGAFIDRYVFPDGELTGSGTIISAMQDAGLEVRHEENLREHYVRTLAAWCANLRDHWDECVEEVGESTARVWGLYMAGSRLGFERNVVQLHQVLGVKLDAHGAAGLPLRPWWDA